MDGAIDDTTRRIVEFATGMAFADLPPEIVAQASMRVLDSVACALASADADPVRIALSTSFGTGGEGRVIGRPDLRLAPDAAAFVNTSMIRYFDFNDWAPNGHPSDVIGALLALADQPGVDGRRFLTATVVAYEVFIALTEATKLPALGWDQGFALGLAAVAGLGNMLALDESTVANALGVMAVAGLPTGAARSGSLSMWKGCATGYATRNAVFATQLAGAGLTGPPAAFEGRRGLWALVTGPFELTLGGDTLRLSRTALKPWPACYHGQAAIEAALELRKRVPVEDLVSIDVGTYAEAHRSIASEPEKWDPQSRETADHSLPFLVARALVDGTVTSDSFTRERYEDPALRPLLARITAHVDDHATAVYPGQIEARIVARDRNGTEHIVTFANPRGHPANPMSPARLAEKVTDLLGPSTADAVLASWSDVSTLDDLFGPLALLIDQGKVAM